MRRDAWQRGAAIGGTVFVVVNAALGLAGSEPPPMTSSAADAARHFTEHAGAVEAGLWLFGLATVGLLWWFGAVYQWMTRTERSVGLASTSLVGFAIGGALSLASAAVWSAAALAAGDLGELARPLNIVGWELRAASGFGLAIHLLATNALAVRDRSLRPGLVAVGALSAVGFVIAGVVSSLSMSDTADVAGLVATVFFSVWVLGVSHHLWRWDTVADAGTAGPAATFAA